MVWVIFAQRWYESHTMKHFFCTKVVWDILCNKYGMRHSFKQRWYETFLTKIYKDGMSLILWDISFGQRWYETFFWTPMVWYILLNKDGMRHFWTKMVWVSYEISMSIKYETLSILMILFGDFQFNWTRNSIYDIQHLFQFVIYFNLSFQLFSTRGARESQRWQFNTIYAEVDDTVRLRLISFMQISKHLNIQRWPL